MFRATPRVTLNTNEPSPGVLPVKKYKLNVFRRHAEMFLVEKYSVRFFVRGLVTTDKQCLYRVSRIQNVQISFTENLTKQSPPPRPASPDMKALVLQKSPSEGL